MSADQKTDSPSLNVDERNTLAEKLKNEGNDFFKKGKDGYEEALVLYKRALELQSTDAKLNAAVLGNMAAAYLNMNKFTECIDHAKRSLVVDPKNVKVWWRAARAAISLELWKNAIEFCESGLAIDAANDELKKCLTFASERHERQQAARAKQDEEDRKRKEMEKAADAEVPEIQFDAEEAEDLQAEVNNLARQIAAIDADMASMKRRVTKADLTAQELNTLVNETPDLYVQVGKAFFMSSRDDVAAHISSEKQTAKDEIPKMEANKVHLEARFKEKELRLKGMVKNMQRRQEAGERVMPDPQQLAAMRAQNQK